MIIGIGLPRTGTSSLRVAVERLGYKAQTNPFDPRRLDNLFAGNVRAAVEADLASGATYLSEPYYAFVPGLVEAFPEAKFIHTLRSSYSWKNSWRRYHRKTPQHTLYHPHTVIQRALLASAFGAPITDDELDNAYFRHLDDIHHLIPNEPLKLVLHDPNLYKKLTNFLGKEPVDEPFPRENESVSSDLFCGRRTKTMGMKKRPKKLWWVWVTYPLAEETKGPSYDDLIEEAVGEACESSVHCFVVRDQYWWFSSQKAAVSAKARIVDLALDGVKVSITMITPIE